MCSGKAVVRRTKYVGNSSEVLCVCAAGVERTWRWSDGRGHGDTRQGAGRFTSENSRVISNPPRMTSGERVERKIIILVLNSS